MIETQLSSGYQSNSDFRTVFAHIIGAAPTKAEQQGVLKASWLDTPLGPMVAIADEQALYLLEFIDRKGLEREVERLRQKTRSAIVTGLTKPIHSIENELKKYFNGEAIQFKTPLHFLGSAFQNQIWQELKKIPHGETRSYLEIAKTIKKPSAFRAVALANSTNQLAIIVPCHRVINTNGKLGGYAAGITRKEWLIAHEKKG